ncbi:hypothetical protein AB4068_15630 [Arthrobacter sp. 2RAF22]|uniref:hypothetical protein n=1 Tax=Arthrobacter sp. 2RAF22 TaxID=3232996 RepID=UPI003F92CCC5
MIGNNTGPDPDTDTAAGIVPVDAAALQDLTEKYTAYRQTMDRDYYDPVRALSVTGEVLASVREIVVNGHPGTPETTSEEAPPQ